MGGKHWSESEQKKLLLLWKDGKPDTEIAEVMGRSVSGIRHKRCRLGMDNRRYWTKEEEAYVFLNWETQGDAEIARTIGRSEHAVKNKRLLMGLERENSQTLPRGVAAMRQLLYRYQYGAEKRGHVWGLTERQFAILTGKSCHYCGEEPTQVYEPAKSANGNYTYNGLDRMDNNGGYVVGNVVPCCAKCNMAKGTMPLGEFIDWAIQLHSHLVCL